VSEHHEPVGSVGVRVERSGTVAVVWMVRPERRNAVTPALGRALVRTLRELDVDPAVRAIVLAGEGPAFCAGADLSILAEGPEALNAFAEDHQLRDLAIAPVLMDTPVATAVQGAAAGAGFVLAIAGDTTFVAPDVRLIPVFPRIGLVAEYGVAWLLPRRVGSARAADILLTGREIDADTAVAWGLANDVASDPVARAVEWAREVAACSPFSVATAKRQLIDAAHQSLAEAHAESLRLMRESFAGPDLPEALLARQEKRDPVFSARLMQDVD